MSEILVTDAVLRQGVADCHGTAGKLDGQLSDLEAFIQPLVAAWEGDAQAAYHAKHQQWVQAQNELNQILQRISQALEAAADDFNATEKANTSLW